MSYIHVLAPCPTGWGYDPAVSLELAREAVQCGLWYLAEFEHGTYTLNYKNQPFKTVTDYLGKQKRFCHLNASERDTIEKLRDKDWLRRMRVFAR